MSYAAATGYKYTQFTNTTIARNTFTNTAFSRALNGAVAGANSTYSNTTTGPNGGIIFGRNANNGGDDAGSGVTMSETIVFDGVLSANDINKVDSYLAIKGGITLNTTNTPNYLSSNSTNVWSGSANTGYNNNIFGIANDYVSDLHQKQSKSVNANQKLIIGAGSSLANTNEANTNSLTNGQFLMVGDNNLAQSLVTPLVHVAPGGDVNNRFAAIWKVQNTGSTGQVIVAWPKGILNLHLIRSVGNDTFEGSDTFIPMTNEITINGVVYNTATATFNNGDYFTLAGFVTAPGGVAGTDFWVKSDDAGTIATAWKDHSINADDISAVGTWALSPADRAHNFHPYTTGYSSSKLFYNNNNSALHSNTGLGTPSNHSIFTSVRPTSVTEGRIVGIDDDTNAAEPAMSITSSGLPNHYEWSNTTTNTSFTNPYITGSVNIFSAVANNAVGFGDGTSTSSGGEKRLGLNGDYQSTTFTGTNRFQLLGRRLRIGHSGFTHGGAFSGDIMEIVWYNRLLTPNEQSRVNTYLALKNGVTLAEDYLASNNNIIWNRTANTGYNTNVFGLARDNSSGLHQKQATSTESSQKLVIGHNVNLFESNEANTNSLTNGQFLIVGDNGLTQGLHTPLAHVAPGGEVNNRFASIWKVQNTNAVGQVIVAWPKGISNLHLVKSVGNDTFDGTDTFIPMTAETTVNGVVYNTATVTFNDGDYFTFAGYANAPGGVVNALSYWYRADKNAANSGAGTDVTSWTDFFSGTVSSQLGTNALPKYAEGAANYFNFNPGVNFTAGTQTLGNTNVRTFSADSYDVFTFTKEGMLDGGAHPSIFRSLVDNASLTGGIRRWDGLGIVRDGRIERLSNTGGNTDYYGTPAGAFSGAIPSIMYHTFTATTTTRALNGAANFGTTTHSGTGVRNLNGGHLFGDSQFGGNGSDNRGFIGHLGETIIYGSGNLTAEERRRVDSYMAIKYGITLGRVATDHYLGSTASASSIVWNGATNIAYNNNIFGIARADIGGFEQKVSKSVNAGTILTVAKNNDFVSSNLAGTRTALPNNESYLLFGDNNDASPTLVTPTEIGDCGELLGSETDIKLIARKWMVQRTNNVGTTYLEANLASYASTLNTDVYMFVANDANFTQNVKMIPGTKTGNNWTFAHNFDNENAVRYITFGGTFVAAPCEQCKGETYTLRTGYQWNQGLWANQTSNQKLNIALGNDANGTPLTASMYADYSENPSIEYVPTRYPQQYGGKWTMVRRYDNTTAKDRHRITLSQAMKASFQISNINTYLNNKNNFEVIGYCNGSVVMPRITYAYNTSYHTFEITGNQAKGNMSWRGFVPNVSTANVRFDRPVDEIVIISSVERANTSKTLRSSLYGDITLECAEVLEPNPDNVYVSHSFTQNTLATCGGETTMRIKVTNNNLCEDKTISLHQLLPAGLSYIPGSFNGNDLPAGTMAATTLSYSGNSLELSGLTLPRGEHWMYVDVANPGTAGTYPTQFTFEVTDGLDPAHTYSSSVKNLNYYNSTGSTPAAPSLELSIKNSVSCGENDDVITYRIAAKRLFTSPPGAT